MHSTGDANNTHAPAVAELLTEALRFTTDYGWCVLPVRRKSTRGLAKWIPYQTNRPSERQLRHLFGRSGIDGLAVVTGPVSGGLIVRDFDAADAYERWRAAHLDLHDLPVSRTRRGFHVFAPPSRSMASSGTGN